jgi:uncharacterized membrane protein (DUF2068 family)
MSWFLANWYIVIAIIALCVFVGFLVYKFIGLPTKEKIKLLKANLLKWVNLAEDSLGSKKGKENLKWYIVYLLIISLF